MTETFLAWCAGFFDGEGHVGIYPRKRRGKVVYVMRAGLTQRVREPLDLIVQRFDGYVALPTVTNCYRWSVNARKAEIFLRAIRPYAVVKAAQIDVALDFMERRIPVGQGSAAVFREQIERNLVLDANAVRLLRELKDAA